MKPTAFFTGLLALIVSGISPGTDCLMAQPAFQAEAWVKTGGPIGGLGYDVRHSFEDPNRWYVTDAWGGIFLSQDRGLTWREINQGITTRKLTDGIPVFCVTVDPHDSNHLWIGSELTGKIYTSEDAGDTWQESGNGIPDTLFPLSFRGFTVDPSDPETVYAMAEIGSPGWTPGGEGRRGLEMDMVKGVVFKTTNGGELWEQIWLGDNLARYCFINPYNTGEIYVSTGIFDRESANTDVESGIAGGVGILRSEDGGQTWQVLNESNGLTDLYVGSLFMHPVNPDTLLAAASQNNWSAYGGEFTGGVFLTTDGGAHWEKVIDTPELHGVVEYCVCDPAVAYAVSNSAVYRSDDGGFSWLRFSRENDTWGPPGVIAGFPIDLQCDPEDPMRVIVNNYLGGNFLSVDGGQTWTLSSDGYTGSLVRCMDVDPEDPARLFVGSRSGVYYSGNGGGSWSGMANPPEGLLSKFNEIASITVNPLNPNSLRAVALDYPGVLYSYDGGKTWGATGLFATLRELEFSVADTALLSGIMTHPDHIASPEHFDEGIHMDPNCGFYRSMDGGLTWHPSEHALVQGECIASHAANPFNPDILYLSKCDGTFLKSENGGVSWEATGTGLSNMPALSLEVSPADPNLLFAGLGYNVPAMGDGLYRSTDAGATWEKLATGLEGNPLVRSIAIDPVNDSIVYVADFLSGVYVTEDRGDTWRQINQGIDHREAGVLRLSSDGSVLYMGAEGGGVYRLGETAAGPSHISIHSRGDGAIRVEHGFPNPFTVSSTIRYTVGERTDLEIAIFTLSGRKVRTLAEGPHLPGTYSVSWDGTGQDQRRMDSGMYLVRFSAGSAGKTIKVSFVR